MKRATLLFLLLILSFLIPSSGPPLVSFLTSLHLLLTSLLLPDLHFSAYIISRLLILSDYLISLVSLLFSLSSGFFLDHFSAFLSLFLLFLVQILLLSSSSLLIVISIFNTNPMTLTNFANVTYRGCKAQSYLLGTDVASVTNHL